jgi:polyphenol oxidase
VLAHHEVRVGVGVAISNRHGGASAGPWASLNLGDHVGDAPEAVRSNRATFHAALGPTAGALVLMRQVHGSTIAFVDKVPDEPPEADALVTATRGLTLVVLVADCIPVLLFDRRAGVVAAVHVGRRGLAGGVAPAAMAAMTDLGARPDHVYAVVGPSVCPAHYEVPADVRDGVGAAAPGSAATTPEGAPALDLRSGLLGQLQQAGVHRLMVMPQCTAEDPDYYSHRRDGRAGRFAAAVWLVA